MKGKIVGLLALVAVMSLSLYRHISVHAATTVSSATAEVCGKVADKLECNAEAAMIDSAYSSCVKACPTKTEWTTYCTKTGDSCEADCELNTDAAQIKACKAECVKRETACKANYKDKTQCTNDCDTARQKARADFTQRWTVKK